MIISRLRLEVLVPEMEAAVQNLLALSKQTPTPKKQNQWAASTFNENFITTLVTLSQRKKVQKKTLEQAGYFWRDFVYAVKQAKSGEQALYEPDLRWLVSALVKGTGNKGAKDTGASPLARLAFEKIIFPYNEDRLYGGATFMAFLENGCREMYPNNIRSHIEDPEFMQYVMKFAMVSRQNLFNGLKNPAR